MAHDVTANLSIGSQPPTGAQFPAGSISLAIEHAASYPFCEHFTRSVGTTEVSLVPAGMTTPKVVCVHVKSGASVILKVSSTGHADQEVVCDGFLVLSLDVGLTALAAVTASGTADVEVLVAGA